MSNLEEDENSNWRMDSFKGHSNRDLVKKLLQPPGFDPLTFVPTQVFESFIGSIDWRNPANLATSSGQRDGQPQGITTTQGRGFESWWQQRLF